MKTVFINGSPKKKLSASSHFLWMSTLAVKGEVVKEQLRNRGNHKNILESIRNADTVVFVLPLYVDGLPSHVLDFLQELDVFCQENGLHLNVYAVSNNGFIEGNQSRVLMQIFENFCARSGNTWCGGFGIGGGVMLNVLRIVFWVYLGMLLLNIVSSGTQEGNWLPAYALLNFAQQVLTILFFHAGVLLYSLGMGNAISKGKDFGVKFTRALMPSFLFILVADIFFTIISVFKGGVFRGWFARK